MIPASKTTFSHFNLKILKPKVKKKLKKFVRSFVNFDPEKHDTFMKTECLQTKRNAALFRVGKEKIERR